MSATVAAALKKIAVAILTDKKARKVVLGIILGILIILVMPLAAIIAIFNGDINIDANRLQTLVVQNMSAEEQARLQRVEDLMYEIEDAEYQLGKIYLYGKEVERDYEKAIAYLSSAAEHGNQYAEQLLHSIQSNRNWSAALGVVRLLHHLSRMIQNQLDDEKKGKTGAIDRKLKRKIDEKKQAHGLKQG